MSQHSSNPTSESLAVVILAAGQGTRLGGNTPKPLRKVSGYPILQHILNTLNQSSMQHVYIVHHPSNRSAFENSLTIPSKIQITWVEQSQRKGTAHALEQALPFIQQDRVLILLGDVPFVSEQTLQACLATQSDLTVVTSLPLSPKGLGRIVRNNQNQVTSIVEEKNLSPAQKSIPEVNSGIMVVPTCRLLQHMPHIKNQNNTGEYLLTDLVEVIAQKPNANIATYQVDNWEEVAGINTPEELIRQEKYFSRCTAMKLLHAGVVVQDPERFDCFGQLRCAKGVVIGPNVIIEGAVNIEENASIGSNCIIRNSQIGAHTTIHPFSLIENTIIHQNANVGPFAYCRNNSVIGQGATMGCFVEAKATSLGAYSKAKHLSYLGDLTIEEHCNIGAGVIHCNYDGQT
jgi:bifunctional UDP-N-acetylglucosamine pyrophosphorylase/glucosamine-1-phosphate N-acetyltransferase